MRLPFFLLFIFTNMILPKTKGQPVVHQSTSKSPKKSNLFAEKAQLLIKTVMFFLRINPITGFGNTAQTGNFLFF